MKKGILIAANLILAFGLFSCKDKKEEMPETLKPETLTIDGNLGALFEIVDDNYKIDKYSSAFKFNVKRTDHEMMGMDKIGFGYEIYNEKGEVIDSKKPVLERIDPFTFPENTMTLKPGQIGSLKIHLQPDKLAGAKTFKIIMECNETDDDETISEEAPSTTEASSDQWDKLLDEYESYCTKVASYAKKAQAGDVSAITEYASLIESAQSLQNKLENAKSDLTPAQAARLGKIASKMASSMM